MTIRLIIFIIFAVAVVLPGVIRAIAEWLDEYDMVVAAYKASFHVCWRLVFICICWFIFM